jgi:hypothetical protein
MLINFHLFDGKLEENQFLRTFCWEIRIKERENVAKNKVILTKEI